ncbi:MAG: LuxR family transcriptional regulator [Actinobacteria bacterium HGW-Actinobacteria-8]|nr:MAG: LuxR family transcriptional regulator [Actinobacteria bacterium HGW-Actinobacteria-8]
MDPVDLTALAAEHLAAARAASHGRSSTKIIGDHAKILRMNLIALKEGAVLQDHESPGEATLMVLQGQIEFRAGEKSVTLDAGNLIEIPPMRHGLTALADAVVILSVAKA